MDLVVIGQNAQALSFEIVLIVQVQVRRAQRSGAQGHDRKKGKLTNHDQRVSSPGPWAGSMRCRPRRPARCVLWRSQRCGSGLTEPTSVSLSNTPNVPAASPATAMGNAATQTSHAIRCLRILPPRDFVNPNYP